jgi:hypothetical protein
MFKKVIIKILLMLKRLMIKIFSWRKMICQRIGSIRIT